VITRGGDLIERAKANSAIRIVARAHCDAELERLRRFGARTTSS
jgi:hypothetical protein